MGSFLIGFLSLRNTCMSNMSLHDACLSTFVTQMLYFILCTTFLKFPEVLRTDGFKVSESRLALN